MADTFAPDEQGLIAGVYCSRPVASPRPASAWIAGLGRIQPMDFHLLTSQIVERLHAIGDAAPLLELGDWTIQVGPQLIEHLSVLFEAAEHGKKVWVLKEEDELTPEQVAEQLGVSRPFVYRLLDRGDLPSRKVGEKHRRVPAAAVAEFLEASRSKVSAAERLAAQAEQAEGSAPSAQDLRAAARHARETGDTTSLKEVFRARQLVRIAGSEQADERTEP